MDEQEIWRDILGYEGCYQVGSFGRVKSLDRLDSWNRKIKGRMMAQRHCRKYMVITLAKDSVKKSYPVHRLVMMAFDPVNNMENLEVNHKDENPENNKPSNLEWMTHAENMKYGTCQQRAAESQMNGKHSKKVKCIETGIIWPSAHEIERHLGIYASNVARAARANIGMNKPTHKSGGFTWVYIGEE